MCHDASVEPAGAQLLAAACPLGLMEGLHCGMLFNDCQIVHSAKHAPYERMVACSSRVFDVGARYVKSMVNLKGLTTAGRSGTQH